MEKKKINKAYIRREVEIQVGLGCLPQFLLFKKYHNNPFKIKFVCPKFNF
jgi:hypothetical protein